MSGRAGTVTSVCQSHYSSRSFSTLSSLHLQKIMESQDEQISTCSSSSTVPIENESEMSLQANEVVDEVIETQEGRFTSKAWKYYKPVK
ncbi:hypothetical protein HAX54_044440, partial [Datura stramonium]|nr:hypothetical protein [Datura stramonium]